MEEYRIQSGNSWIPIEVKTRSPITNGHSDYWNNIDEVYVPFANRLLGTNQGSVWPQDNDYDSNHRSVSRWNRRLLLLIVPALLLVFGAFFQGDAAIGLNSEVPEFSLIAAFRQGFRLPEIVDDVFAWIDQNGYGAIATVLSIYLLSIVGSAISLFRKIFRIRQLNA